MTPIPNSDLLKISRRLGWEIQPYGKRAGFTESRTAVMQGAFEGHAFCMYEQAGNPAGKPWDPRRSIEDALELPRLLGLRMRLKQSGNWLWWVELLDEKGKLVAETTLARDLPESITRAVLAALEVGE